MIKGLAITSPVLGHINIGEIVVQNGKKMLKWDNQFIISSQIQGKYGYIQHPLDEQFRANAHN